MRPYPQRLCGSAEPDAAPPHASSLALWYRQPAERWLEALPVGNGRLGAMVFGGATEERLALSESTFWSGAPSDQHENPQACAAFAEIRELFKAGKCLEAQPLVAQLLGRRLNYGTNLPVGYLLLTQSGTDGHVRDYRRELDLDGAVARVTFTANGLHFRREVLASHPDGVMAVRLSADRPGVIGFTLRYHGGQFPWAVKTWGKDTLVVSGHAFEKKHSDGKSGVAFQALFRAAGRRHDQSRQRCTARGRGRCGDGPHRAEHGFSRTPSGGVVRPPNGRGPAKGLEDALRKARGRPSAVVPPGDAGFGRGGGGRSADGRSLEGARQGAG